MQRVLVTGGTGFIAGWAIVELLRRGYHVRTTVRGADQEAWVRRQIATQTDPGVRLSFAVADLTRDAGWDAAVSGCDQILHVAAPVGVHAPRDPDALIVPTRDGALRLLRAACDAGVQRVVLTSAIEACRPLMASPDRVVDETGWTDARDPLLGPYRLAKTLAEKAAWEFMAGRPGRTTLTTILPSAVIGPVFGADYARSLLLTTRLLNGRMPGIPRIGFCVADVRDVADLHILAMTAPEAAGERFIAASDWMWLADVARTLRNPRPGRAAGADTPASGPHGADRFMGRPFGPLHCAPAGAKARFHICQGAGAPGLEAAPRGGHGHRRRPKRHRGRRRLTGSRLAEAMRHSDKSVAMTMLITGAIGRVGTRLLPRLVAAGLDCRALMRGGKAAPAGATAVEADLADPAPFCRRWKA